jgi:hypothetical protein
MPDSRDWYDKIPVSRGCGLASYKKVVSKDWYNKIPVSRAFGLASSVARSLARDREFFIDNLLVRIHLIIEMI